MIEIEFVTDEPVEGWVRCVTRTRPLRPTSEIRFSGWLGLLQAIVTLVGSPGYPGVPRATLRISTEKPDSGSIR